MHDSRPDISLAPRELEQELQETRKEFHAVVSKLVFAQEELKAKNTAVELLCRELRADNDLLKNARTELEILCQELMASNGKLEKTAAIQRTSQDELSCLIASVDLAALVLSPALNIKRFTPAATEVFALIPSDLGRPITDISWRVDDPDLIADIREALTTRLPIHRLVQDKAGDEWFNRRLLPYVPASGPQEDVVVVYSRITEFKRESERIETALHQAKAIIQSIRRPIAVLDQSLTVQLANSAFSQTFGYVPSTVAGTPFFDLGDGEWNIEPLRKALMGVKLANETFDNLEVTINTGAAGRRVLLVDCRQIATSPQNGALILLAARDVTESHLFEREFQDIEAFQRSILAKVPDAMIIFDQNGVIQFFSASAERLFGYSAAEVAGLNFHQIIPSSERLRRGSLGQFLKEARKRSAGVKRRAYDCRRKDGSAFPCEFMLSEDIIGGKPVYTAFIRDVTEHLNVEQQLMQALKMEAMGHLSGGIAHDFNNLLTVILGNLELLERLTKDQRQRDLIHQIGEAVTNGAQLTERLTSFARSKPLQLTVLDLNALISELSGILSRVLGDHIEAVTQLDDALWPVTLSGGQLETALLNLVVNARDAMPHGGKLILSARNVSLDPEAIHNHLDLTAGDYVELSVRDTGSGMPPQVAARAVEPFFTTKDKGMGTGLGLSMVYDFVKQSKGDIVISSEIGRGTVVTIYLPRSKKPAAVARPRPKTAVLPRGRGETVLVVEDDVEVRKVTVSQLENLGYKVVETRNAVEAAKLMKEGLKPALVFTDIVMPGGLSGLDLYHMIRQWTEPPKVLCASGYFEDVIFKDAREMEELTILKKPYSQAHLAEKIREALDS